MGYTELTRIEPADRDSGSLYRPESIEALRSRFGRPAPLARLANWLLILFLVAIAAGAVLFFTTSQFSRKETVDGLLQPADGAARITYHRPAVVQTVHVRDGQQVRRGDPIFSLALDQHLTAGATLGTRLEEASDRQDEALGEQRRAAQAGGLAELRELGARRAEAARQQASLTSDLRLQSERLTLQEETLAGLSQLEAQGFVSEMRLRDKQGEVLALRLALSELRRRASDTEALLMTLDAQLERSRSAAAEHQARYRAEAAEIERMRAQTASERAVILTAPHDGRVVTIRARPGTAVEPGAALAIVLPLNTHLVAELWAPSRAAGFLRVGDEVRLMYDAFPFQRFGSGTGRVIAVSNTPVEPEDLPIRNERPEALYRVRVALDRQVVEAYGRRWPLVPGGRLRADLILDRQSFLDWILDPIRASRARNTL